jgi:hypothetical protein
LVWRLLRLLETLCTAAMDGDSVEDEEAAIRGLIEYADGVHEALDLAHSSSAPQRSWMNVQPGEAAMSTQEARVDIST